jgi:hypothetical protein
MVIFNKDKEEQLKVAKQVVDFWGSKLKFSLVSLLFFLSMVIIYSINPFFGLIPTIVLGGISIVFVQQTIRSYNYLKFSKMSYISIELMFEFIDDMK